VSIATGHVRYGVRVPCQLLIVGDGGKGGSMFYLVSAVVTRTVDGWTGTVASPTFLLDSNIQGITSTEGAERIALRMVQEIAGPDAEVHVSVNPAHDVATV
jgi:hypothetical protein